MIAVCMVVRNEAGTLESALADLCADGYVGEILISDHHSDDQTEKIIQTFVKNSPKVKQVVLGDLSLNERFLCLLSEASADYVQVRTPHDLYHEDFYSFHYQRMRQNEEADCSFSHATNATKNFKMSPNINSLFPLELGPLMSFSYSRLLDPNFSSCGFVGKTQAVRNAWSRHVKLGQYCDWLVKKELSQISACVISFKTLAIYEDRIPSKTQTSDGDRENEVNSKRREHYFESFWTRNKIRIAIDHEPKWRFLILKSRINGIFWVISYLRLIILSYSKVTKRSVVRLFQRRGLSG